MRDRPVTVVKLPAVVPAGGGLDRNLGQEAAVPVVDQRSRTRRLKGRVPQHQLGAQGADAECDKEGRREPRSRDAAPSRRRRTVVVAVRADHREITMRWPALAPWTPGRYIVSASPGGCVKLPAMSARVRNMKR